LQAITLDIDGSPTSKPNFDEYLNHNVPYILIIIIFHFKILFLLQKILGFYVD